MMMEKITLNDFHQKSDENPQQLGNEILTTKNSSKARSFSIIDEDDLVRIHTEHNDGC